MPTSCSGGALALISQHLRSSGSRTPAATAAATAAAAAPGPLACVEMRVYTAAAGQLEHLHCLFSEHTAALFAKHGILGLGFFRSLEHNNREQPPP